MHVVCSCGSKIGLSTVFEVPGELRRIEQGPSRALETPPPPDAPDEQRPDGVGLQLDDHPSGAKLVHCSQIKPRFFSIPAGLRFADGGNAAAMRYRGSPIYTMRISGDEIEAQGPLIDEETFYQPNENQG
ncbi:hypothetical protein THAOC_24636, partial [Thalassiosira oceanica]